MRRSVHLAVAALWLLALCIPLAAVLTLALLPLWSWLEATRGIESVGHSGPAAWCYRGGLRRMRDRRRSSPGLEQALRAPDRLRGSPILIPRVA
ncbi:MAG TPA: hypothetical protein VEB59_14245 [Gemmatimonadales bacterium]|nr:hypothetical protein [Gemmatimonadales bacterium]